MGSFPSPVHRPTPSLLLTLPPRFFFASESDRDSGSTSREFLPTCLPPSASRHPVHLVVLLLGSTSYHSFQETLSPLVIWDTAPSRCCSLVSFPEPPIHVLGHSLVSSPLSFNLASVSTTWGFKRQSSAVNSLIFLQPRLSHIPEASTQTDSDVVSVHQQTLHSTQECTHIYLSSSPQLLLCSLPTLGEDSSIAPGFLGRDHRLSWSPLFPPPLHSICPQMLGLPVSKLAGSQHTLPPMPPPASSDWLLLAPSSLCRPVCPHLVPKGILLSGESYFLVFSSKSHHSSLRPHSGVVSPRHATPAHRSCHSYCINSTPVHWPLLCSSSNTQDISPLGTPLP